MNSCLVNCPYNIKGSPQLYNWAFVRIHRCLKQNKATAAMLGQTRLFRLQQLVSIEPLLLWLFSKLKAIIFYMFFTAINKIK